MTNNKPENNSTESVVHTAADSPVDKSADSVVNTSAENDDGNEFIRLTAAHQMLAEAQKYDEQNNYPLALHYYRLCVDFLLEELIFTEGTAQSRSYLHEKSTAVMDRIDLLKLKLQPIPTSEQSINHIEIPN